MTDTTDRPSSDSLETDELLAEAKSVVPPSGCDSEPPSAPDSDSDARERAVRAWNKLATRMVDVVKTIRKNEKRQRLVALAVWAAMLVGISAAFYLAVQAELAVNRLADSMLREQRAEMVKMTKKQDATLTAVLELSKAISAKLEADVAQSPEADDEAAAAALDAQKAALQAKVEVSDSYAEKAEVAKAIKKVEKKAAEKKALDSKDSGWDDEGLAGDAPAEEGEF